MAVRKNMLLIILEEANITLSESHRFLQLAEDPEEALRRYSAVVEVMLAQLVGLSNCHVRFLVKPAEAIDAVRFWVLPLLRGEVKIQDSLSGVYEFIPEQYAPSVTIDFTVEEGSLGEFESVARLSVFCVDCGSRLLNMAFSQCSVQRSVYGEGYLTVTKQGSEPKERIVFPDLLRVDSDEAWQAALLRPIGGKLEAMHKKHLDI